MRTKSTLTLCALALTMVSPHAVASDFNYNTVIEKVLRSPVTLTKAIGIATAKVNGRVISAEIEDTSPMIAEIKIVTPEAANTIIVNLDHASIVSGPHEGVLGKAYKYTHKYESLGQVSVKLLDAIAVAEEKTGGRAVKIQFTREKGVAIYEVETVSDKAHHRLDIDAHSKEILKSKFRKVQ